MIRQDSIQTSIAATTVNDTVARQYNKPQTPYQVLRLLPKDATPAQQDSAIQAWLGPREIQYSKRPDTLHLPGDEIPHDMKVVDIPLYYRENFFSNDTLYHEELQAGSNGIAGDPVPYAINNDDIITGLLILCFLFIAFALSRISDFIGRQLNSFFYIQGSDRNITETGSEINFQIAFIGLTCLIYGLLYYLYATTYVADTFTLSSEYVILGIFTGIFTLYFPIRFILYHIVNSVFFDKNENGKFLTSLLFLTAMEGLLLFPLLLMLAFMRLSMLYAIIYCALVVLLVKILTFYKSFAIFFKQKEVFLQIILYFCALEIVPLLSLLGSLSVIVDVFKIKI